jgi:rhamnosyltransferase subunit B
MLAIGTALRRRGFDVAISLAEPYAELAEQAGLLVKPIVDHESFGRIMADPAVWKLLRGMRKVVRSVAADFTEPHFDWIKSIHRPDRTVLVSHPLDFASRIFRDVDPTTPLVDVHLAPVMLRNPHQPAHLTPWFFEPTRNRWTFRASYFLGDVIILDPLLAGPINRIRRKHGLSPVKRVMHRWWLSPDRVLALYPDWFAPTTVGLLPQLRHVGFPLHDACEEDFEPPSDRPIVFTGGTANLHSRAFFSRVTKLCREMKLPAMLLSAHKECFPERLPAGVRTLGYVPLGKLLPHCRAIVHHGGIGTTSQALRCGVPQILRPMAFDQFDNAARVSRLGCGLGLYRDRDLATCLKNLLEDSQYRQHCREVSARFDHSSASERAADQIEAVLTRKTRQV